MIRLSAFADEISPDLEEQIALLRGEDIGLIDLRSVWDINVLSLSDEQIARVGEALTQAGIRVNAIGSPIGKVAVDVDWEPYLRLFDRALDVAEMLNAPFVRIFSFYPPEGDMNETEAFYMAVLHLRELSGIAASGNTTLLLENEKGVYGDTAYRLRALVEAVGDPGLSLVFDPANFIQVGDAPYPDAYDLLRPRIRALHVKDALPDGEVMPAGAGISRWPELIRALYRDGFDGVLSLEPHLAGSGQFSGFSGPQLFREASAAIRTLLSDSV